MKATDFKNGYMIYETTWQGRDLEIRHMQNFAAGFDHVETQSVENTPLPITETGYRSLFLLPERVAEYGNAVDYVLAWLDHEAQSDQWKQTEADRQQLSLF